MNVFLAGKHSNRTPLSYSPYKPFFEKFFNYVPLPESADILFFGFVADLYHNIFMIEKCRKLNPNLKIIVLSEEPLWDSLWGGGFLEKHQTRIIRGVEIDFVYLNHSNSDIFQFNKIPYFITTNDDFISRYQFLFLRNSRMSPQDIRKIWDSADFNAAFFAEFRDDIKYDAFFNNEEIIGLSNIRTKLALNYSGDNIIRVGAGWGANTKRQYLPDWHLDKLATLDKRCRFISAVENTHQNNYISEKIFDAFAMLGIPLYFSGENHAVHDFVPLESFINIKDNISDNYCSSLISMDSYMTAQNYLSSMFSNSYYLFEERSRLVGRVISYCS